VTKGAFPAAFRLPFRVLPISVFLIQPCDRAGRSRALVDARPRSMTGTATLSELRIVSGDIQMNSIATSRASAIGSTLVVTCKITVKRIVRVSRIH
jgi:hypothetical protein